MTSGSHLGWSGASITIFDPQQDNESNKCYLYANYFVDKYSDDSVQLSI